ncbi:TIGR03986 family CRISPR-associated RAMP protein [Vibrio sp.]|nr:TIGR03986 family CRISPR-associated RAMP protein [Vibrio sp.]
MSNEVHAPYHFVPLSKWVYMPDWAHLVSQDFPFEDGYSGVIEYNLTNPTPLCVGSQKDANGVLKFARDPLGRPIIPSSSLKGMIRNVLEIASFGKFGRVDDSLFSYRDISSRSAYLEEIKSYSVTAGWIKFNSIKKNWEFKKSQYGRLKHSDLNAFTGKNFVNKNGGDLVSKYKKHNLNKTLNANITNYFDKTAKKTVYIAELNKSGAWEGSCVFTDERPAGRNHEKFYDFSYFFSCPDNEVFSNAISEQVNHLFTNHRSQQNTDIKQEDKVSYLQNNQHNEWGIPIFALVKDKKVHSFGFSQMPRLTYNNSIHDLVDYSSKAHLSDAYFDLAELMMGTVREHALSLKSRLSFSDASLDDNNARLSLSEKMVLSSPKPTFLAAYLEQPHSGKYQTYNDLTELSGWKQYPNRTQLEIPIIESENDKLSTQLEVLDEGHSFTGRIFFHNLKKEELSALTWALTLNNDKFNYHRLGNGKPVGLGSVQIKINEEHVNVRDNKNHQLGTFSTQDHCSAFKAHMDQVYCGKEQWSDSPQIKHLIALSDRDIENDNDFTYMNLEDYKDVNNAKASLPPLSLPRTHLSRTTQLNESTSLSLGQGRLSKLIDKECNFLKMELENQSHERTRREIAKEKEQRKQDLKNIQSSELSPLNKIYQQLSLIVEEQDQLNNTEKKKRSKDLRELNSQLKQIEVISPTEQSKLTSLYEQITFSVKDAKKGLKALGAL